MKKVLFLLMFASFGVFAKTTVPNLVAVHTNYMVGDTEIVVYQHTISHNCYVRYGSFRGSFAQVDCKDFNVLTRQEREQIMKQHELEEYKRLAEKFGQKVMPQ